MLKLDTAVPESDTDFERENAEDSLSSDLDVGEDSSCEGENSDEHGFNGQTLSNRQTDSENDEGSSNDENKTDQGIAPSEDFNLEHDDSYKLPVITNAAWVDSIANILKTNKPKGKKTLVLSKAKKLTEVKRKAPVAVSAGYQVQTETGEVKPALIHQQVESDGEESTLVAKRKRRDIPSVRSKPNILEKDRERVLAKIATKGVVQLFNAVRMQQKDIKGKLEDAGSLEVKRDKALKNIDKRQFLNVLMGKKSEDVGELTKVVEEKTRKSKKTVSDNKSEEPTWGVLKDDFMMKAKLKDWDKELEDDNEMEVE